MIHDIASLICIGRIEQIKPCKIVPGDQLDGVHLPASTALSDITADGLKTECVASSTLYTATNIARDNGQWHPRPEHHVEAG